MAEQPKVGSIVHVEFAVKDPKKVKDFYGNLFGWKFQEVPEMNYTLFEAPGGPGGGIGPVQEGQHPGITNYLYVENIDETMNRITEAGGKIVAPKQEVPGQGWMAWFEDPAGTRMALWQQPPRPTE
jgi:predicted enzyme related to lactoylglutathione lyase